MHRVQIKPVESDQEVWLEKITAELLQFLEVVEKQFRESHSELQRLPLVDHQKKIMGAEIMKKYTIANKELVQKIEKLINQEVLKGV
mgnify:CR=1 FL=1